MDSLNPCKYVYFISRGMKYLQGALLDTYKDNISMDEPSTMKEVLDMDAVFDMDALTLCKDVYFIKKGVKHYTGAHIEYL